MENLLGLCHMLGSLLLVKTKALIMTWIDTVRIRLILSVFLAVALSGCSSMKGWIGPESSLFGGGRVTSAGVDQLFPDKFEEIELPKLPDPDWIGWNEGQRNNLQDSIIAAANQRCGLYQTYLKQLQGKTNVTLGTLATVLGGVGAIVTAADTARAFAGSAGIVSGTRAEFNQAIFLNAAIPVIVKGIEQRRERLKGKILEHRKDPTATYTVALAVADAVDYHNACAIGKGLEEAHEALQLQENPGLTDLAKTLERIKDASKTLNDLQTANIDNELQQIKKQIEIAEEKAKLNKLKPATGEKKENDGKEKEQ